MTWPAAQVKTNVDSAADDPKLARSDFAANVDKFNQLQAHVTSFMQTFLNRATAALARTDLALLSAALKNTGTSGDAVPLLNTLANFSNQFLLSGTISPSQVTADTNNYNPTSLSGATFVRANTDASRNITGLQGGAAGRLLVFTNIGSFDIVLTSEDALSTAANRFLFAAGDKTLTPEEAVLLRYDGVSSRWRAANDVITSGVTRGTAVVTTSGTQALFSGIAAGTSLIHVGFFDVSLSGTNQLMIRLGDSGGIEATSDYSGHASNRSSEVANTTGFRLTNAQVEGSATGGVITLARADGNKWGLSGQLGDGSAAPWKAVGHKELTGELTQLQVRPHSGNSFDGGVINIVYQ